MKKLKEYYILIIIIMQPFLDVIAYFTMGTFFSIVPFIIRSMILLISTIYVLFKKRNKYYIIYLSILFIYTIFHLGNTYFTTNVNLIDNIEEFIRVFYLPILTVNGFYIVGNDEKKIEQIRKGIIINIIIIFIIIIAGVITNTTVNTYAEGYGLRGWFYNSNSQSIILCFCVPFALYYLFKKNNVLCKIISSAIAFFLLYSNGTTGCYLMIIPTFGLLMLDSLFYTKDLKKKLIELFILLIPVCSAVIFYKYSPDYKITQLSKASYSETEKNTQNYKDESEKGEGTDGKCNIGEKNEEINNGVIPVETFETKLITYYFNYNFIKDFGYDKILNNIGSKLDVGHLINNRFRKKTVSSVIYNNSPIQTKLLGIDFAQVKSYDSDMESDYSAIFYYFGIIGIIVYLIPFIYIAFIILKKIYKNKKIIFQTEFILLISMFIMLNLFAELSGSLLKRPNASIYLCLLMVYINGKYERKNNEE